MAEETGGEKNLPASPRKKQRAREEGNIARSQDLTSAVALTAALLALLVLGPQIFLNLVESGRYFLGNATELTFDHTPPQSLALRAIFFIARSVLPFMLAMIVAGLALNFVQVGFLVTVKPLQPKLNRLNIISGFKKFGSLRTLIEAIKSVAKLTLVCTIVWLAIRSRWMEFIALMELTPLTLLPAVAGLVVSVWWRVALAMLVIGLLDYAYQYWQYERDLRMTVQEAKEELKELEGDPHIKRRVRQLQRQIATQRMMAEVPKADVIITNPTEYAVALRYDMATMDAPVVVAKGARLLAKRIRELAVEHDVPIVEKPELARTLYRTIDLGQSIPEGLFRAVAEVLSFVYSIDRRAEKIRERAALLQNRRIAV